MNITKFVPDAVTQKIGRIGLLASKHSPEILFGVGVVGMVTTTVLACKATLKVDDILVETSAKLTDIKELQHDDYSDEDRVKDKAIVLTQTSVKLLKLYAPPLMLGVLSLGCFAGSYKILSQRNLGLMAAYASLEKAYSTYRERVVAEFGPEKDLELLNPTSTFERYNEETKKIEKIEGSIDGPSSPYARLFDATTTKNWNREGSYNQFFIQSQQNYANDLLRSRGHVFLNDVFDMLGLSRTRAGAVTGWVMGNGDSYIDFGVFRGNEFDSMRFVMGDERSLWLDFNVDGVIYDKI